MYSLYLGGSWDKRPPDFMGGFGKGPHRRDQHRVAVSEAVLIY